MARTMIAVENVGKQFQIGSTRAHDTLRDALAGMLRFSRKRKQSAGEDFWALKDIAFTVEEGEVVGLIGGNGAGKSTLLKILSHIHLPTTGSVTLHGRVASLLEVGTGFHPELTGRENIFLNGAILGMTRQEIHRKFDEIVEFAEIHRFLDTPVKRYSSGMYVRLAFAVAAHLEPEILLVDEVLAVGDVAFQKKCLGKMNEVTQHDGRTIIFVSHNLSAIQKLCPRALLLKNGRLIADGPVEDTLHAYLNDIAEKIDHHQIEGADHVDLAGRTDRQGDGRVSISRISFYDDADNALPVMRTGQNVRFVFEYRTKSTDDLKNVTMSMAVSNQMGEIVLNLLNTASGNAIQVLPRASKIVLNIPRLPLVPGKYYFNTFLTVEGAIADWVLDAGYFQVTFGDFFGSGALPPEGQGSVLIPHTWAVQA